MLRKTFEYKNDCISQVFVPEEIVKETSYADKKSLKKYLRECVQYLIETDFTQLLHYSRSICYKGP